jgi:Peptidase family S41
VRCTRLAPLLLAGLAGCAAPQNGPAPPAPVPDELLTREFTPAELAADVDELFAIVEEVHPDPYTVLPREEVGRRRAALIAGLDRPLTRCEFQPRLAELVAALGDGHTSMRMPQEEWKRGPSQACFPLDVAWDGAALRVRHAAAALGEAPAPGARLLSIDGRPADELFRHFLAQHGGETESFRVILTEQSFAVHLWLEGLKPPYRVSVEPEGGAPTELELPGLDASAVPRGVTSGKSRRVLERRPDGVAVLSIDALGDERGDFDRFLQQSFRSLHDEPARGLVIDLRRNSGGNSQLGDDLLQYLARVPWRQAARKEWKASERYREFAQGRLPDRMKSASPGTLVAFEGDMTEPRDEPLRFEGPVAFLIGPYTFSSAMSLAAAVKEYRLALLVGEPTGGEANGFGEVLNFRLPRTQLAGQVSSARFVGPSGDATARGGVEPDVLARAEPGAAGDPVLEAAVRRLLP